MRQRSQIWQLIDQTILIFLTIFILLRSPYSISIPMDSVVSSCINCTARSAKYVGELEENTTALSTELEELKRIRNDINRRVEIAEEQQHLKRLEQVQGWLLRVEGFEAQVEKLLADAQQQISHKCLGVWCPRPGNCISSYGLGKNVAKKLEEVNVLKTKGTFEIVADKLPLASGSGDERPSEPTVGLESTFDVVCNYIEDEQVGVIGIYGMGGIGKTTLLTQINNMLFNTCQGFDVVIWVTVSKNPNLAMVQDVIGERIGFNSETWTRKSQEDKAIDIFRVLKRKKFILLLDDLWDRFDLKKMGVPIPDKQNKSKVVFTTRSKDVCGRMGVHRKIEVKCLTREKAWDLFQQKVGEDTLKVHPEIPKLAEIVAAACSGLPLVLITIGRAMACKSSPQEWHHAIAVLKKSAAEFSGMDDEVFPLLKFSYDALPSDIVRSCFLYCSLFPEDSDIYKHELIHSWISEGYLDGNHEVNGAQNQGHEIIGTLMRACLLEEHGDFRDYVRMHDIVRDMALWIGCECGREKDKFQVYTREGLTKAPEVEKWKVVERMSLIENDIEELKEAPLCPNLSTLLLTMNKLRMMSGDFFQSMPNLRVLDMSGNYNLDVIPMRISELVTLQYLNLSKTRIVELPIEFKNLVELKVLVLNCTGALRIIPIVVLSSFKKLQVLKMFNCGASDLFGESEKPEFFEHNLLTCCPKTLIAELECLKGLNYLTFTIRTASAFSPFINSPKLQSCTKALLLRNFTGLKYLDMSFLESMIHLETLIVTDLVDLEYMMVESAGKGMENLEIIKKPYFHCLRYLRISNCPILKDLTWLIFAPSFEFLSIEACRGMEEVISGHQRVAGEGGCLNPLSNLKILVLVDLPNLKCIYSDPLPFPCLKNVIVGINCPKLKKLPFNSNSAKGGRQVHIQGYDEWWNALEWEDEATRIAFLPTFRASSQLTRMVDLHYKSHTSLKSDMADLLFTDI